MNQLSRLLTLSESEKEERGLLYTPAEIAQQPATWQTTHRLSEEFREELASFLHHAHSERRIMYMIGAGTSDYIGHFTANLLRTCWECQVSAVASKNLLTNRDDLIIADPNHLWVSFSRSGDSPEGVAVLKQALTSAPRIRHLVVSRNKNRLMVQLAQESRNCFAMLLDDEINDRGLAMTSSFTNIVVFGQHLAHLWDKQSFEATLDRMTEAADYILDEGAHLAHTLAQRGYRRACFVGAGVLGEISRESALKLLELSNGGIQTMYETTLGLRHGPMSSLNQEALFTRFLSTYSRAKKVVRTIVAVGGKDSTCDYSLHSTAFDGRANAYRPAVDVIFSQMLELFASIELGLKPDSPSSNGVISRVVEKFAIYA